ncbi:MAG: response regulator [Eubacteriales bacterium]|nr:response regulator [Eubacteriales bacterium]
MEPNIAVLTAAIQNEYEVFSVRGGEEALRVLEQNPGIVAMITDVVMPTMDGLTLIRTIRADNKYKNLAILANTQCGDLQQEEQLLSVGADDFVHISTTA